MSANPILIVGEHLNGVPRAVSLEMIAATRQVVANSGAEVVVAVFGANVAEVAAAFAAAEGVDQVLTVSHDALVPFLAGPWTAAVSDLARQVNPGLILVPASITGRDYAARVAARLGMAMASDAIALDVNDAGDLVVTRAVLGARAHTLVTVAGQAPLLVTIAPGAFAASHAATTPAPIDAREVAIDDTDQRVRLVSSVNHTGGAKGITEAERIVAGGRGLGKAENFALVEELAVAMKAAVGASGATVGAGWRSHADQVGSTGHAVSPALYVAVGISGAPQHLVGMADSEWVVAINRDPQAPMFAIADFGIVGDLFDVVPELTRQLRQ